MARFFERLIWILGWLLLATLGREACWGAGIDPDFYAFVLVIAPPETGVGCGTGVVMQLPCGHRYVLSCAHCVSEGMRIKTLTGNSSQAHIMAINREDDMCLFSVDQSAVEGLPCYSLATQTPRRGDVVFSGGFGTDCELAVFKGEVIGTIGDYEKMKDPRPNVFYEPRGVWFSGPARRGDSGGPIINSKGQLVGVFSGTLDNFHTRVGSSHDELNEFIAKARKNCFT